MVLKNTVTMRFLTIYVVLALSITIEAWGFYDYYNEYEEDTVSSDRLSSILSTPEECARDCKNGEKPKTCYYKFVVEYYGTMTEACDLCRTNQTIKLNSDCQCILGDGFERSGLITVNRMYPGPAIIVCKHDNLVVDVDNRVAGNAITIHWHGVHQKGFQYADGIPYVTQCPIIEGTTFRYQWQANNPGTHFWHAHTGLQKGEGLMGPLLIREPKATEINGKLWDFDTIDKIIYLTDWFHDSYVDHFPGTIRRRPTQLPDNFLINGMGQWTNVVNGVSTTTTTPLATFVVKQGSRYRFRLINACGLNCPVRMTIQGHNLTIIASDGELLVPTEVTTISSTAAERYDFILNANKKIGTYWIQFHAIGECWERKMQQLALLRYETAQPKPLLQAPTFDAGLSTGIILNEPNVHCEGAKNPANVLCYSQLKNAKRVPRALRKKKPDVQLYLGFAFRDYNTSSVFQAGSYKTFLVIVANDTTVETVPYVGNITNVFPSSPLLTQRADIPNEQICNIGNLPATCKGPEPCVCTHVEDIPLNAVVELVLVDESTIQNLSHPFHLHGHSFYVVGGGSSEMYNIPQFNLPIIKNLDDRGLIKRQLTDPPAKDTFAIPNNGFSIIRFIANNPGYWLFHCHFEFHLAVGMVTTFHVGQPRDLEAVPEGFPKCGSYEPPLRKGF